MGVQQHTLQELLKPARVQEIAVGAQQQSLLHCCTSAAVTVDANRGSGSNSVYVVAVHHVLQQCALQSCHSGSPAMMMQQGCKASQGGRSDTSSV